MKKWRQRSWALVRWSIWHRRQRRRLTEEPARARAEMVDVQPPQKRRPVPPANDDALRSDHGRDLC